MNQKDTLLFELNKSFSHTLSYEELELKTGQDKTMIIKNTDELLKQNFPIHTENEKIRLDIPLYSKKGIFQHLSEDVDIMMFNSVNSTNTYAREHLDNLQNGSILIAYEQTHGKGRLGRTWDSQIGKSLALSIVLKDINHLHNPELLTQLTAAALTQALIKDFPTTKIKWPNDILINGKKVVGILTEGEFSNGKLDAVVIGMGINLNQSREDFPIEIRKKATSLREIKQRLYDPNRLIAHYIENFNRLVTNYLNTNDPQEFLTICRNYSALMGKDVISHDHGKERKVHVIDIAEDGTLVVKDLDTEQIEHLVSTEISLRSEYNS